MKLSKLANLLIIGLVLTVAATGCKKKPVGLTLLPAAKAGGVGDPGTSGALPSGQGIGESPSATSTGIPLGPGHPNWPEDRGILQADTVYFDFDSSVVKAGEQGKVAHVADYLKGNAASAVLIEGHCDERGTEEYNRSLGQRRALALREELVRLGVDSTRVDATTFGKDRPADPGHDETAWKKNRRGEFVVLTPPK